MTQRLPTHDDLLKMQFLAQPVPSPDGTRVAFLVSRADMERNGYDADLWLCDLNAGTTRQLTFSGREKFFGWAPDGRSILLASGRGDVPEKTTRFWELPLDGGEARQAFDVPLVCSGLWALPDGRVLVKGLYEASEPRLNDANYTIFTELPFAANGSGFTPSRRQGLALWDGTTLRRLTAGDTDVETVTLSADGAQALFVATVWKGVKPPYNGVYQLDLTTGDVTALTEGLTQMFQQAAWRNDQVIVTAADGQRTGLNQDFRFHVLEDGMLTVIAPELDGWFGDSICCDSHLGAGGERPIFFDRDGQLVFLATRGTTSNVYGLETSGQWRALTDLTAVNDLGVAGGTVAFTGHRGLELAELYVLRAGEAVRLTDFNDWMAELELSTPEHVTFPGGNGLELDGWIMKPAGFESGKKYPTILHIHGGPKATFGAVYFHEMQCWAAAGYAVIYCNPRGADGRNDDFDDIRGHYGDWDYADLMAFVDWCPAHADFVDDQRLFVTGGSYGGYMTNWIVGRTDRFRAACAQRSISNWTSMYGSSDIGYSFVPDQHVAGSPWETPDRFWNDSPLKHAGSVVTPLLLIHSDMDLRCDMNQATQMFTALRVRGIECRLCLFHDETHELSRSGKPKERLARLGEILRWFDAHR